MIQLQHPTPLSQSVAIWTDTKITSTGVVIDLIDDFSGETTSIDAPIESNKFINEFGGWVIARVNGGSVPTGSGQYTVNVFESSVEVPTWANTTKTWGQVVQSWANYSSELIKSGSAFSTDRALVSGSDYDTITKYEYLEDSNYTVYNG